jgi:hypothetical protein
MVLGDYQEVGVYIGRRLDYLFTIDTPSITLHITILNDHDFNSFQERREKKKTTRTRADVGGERRSELKKKELQRGYVCKICFVRLKLGKPKDQLESHRRKV